MHYRNEPVTLTRLTCEGARRRGRRRRGGGGASRRGKLLLQLRRRGGHGGRRRVRVGVKVDSDPVWRRRLEEGDRMLWMRVRADGGGDRDLH